MSQPDSRKATILIVDDVDDIRVGLRLLLQKHGYAVLEARDGREAEKLAKADQPDLILMDLFMPKHDGFTSAREIHRAAELQNIPIIAISAYGDLGIEPRLRQDTSRQITHESIAFAARENDLQCAQSARQHSSR